MSKRHVCVHASIVSWLHITLLRHGQWLPLATMVDITPVHWPRYNSHTKYVSGSDKICEPDKHI